MHTTVDYFFQFSLYAIYIKSFDHIHNSSWKLPVILFLLDCILDSQQFKKKHGLLTLHIPINMHDYFTHFIKIFFPLLT